MEDRLRKTRTLMPTAWVRLMISELLYMNLAGWAFSTTATTGFCPLVYGGYNEKRKQETHTSIFASTFFTFFAFLFSTFVQPSSVSSTRTSKGFGDILAFLWAGELGVDDVVEGLDRFIAT